MAESQHDLCMYNATANISSSSEDTRISMAPVEHQYADSLQSEDPQQTYSYQPISIERRHVQSLNTRIYGWKPRLKVYAANAPRTYSLSPYSCSCLHALSSILRARSIILSSVENQPCAS